jgi:hypothetical protein
MRCIHCPAPERVRCAGLDVRRYCELIDPSCPQYDSGYLEVIVREARRSWEDTDSRLASQRHPRMDKSTIDVDETIVIPADCCGGGVPPGLFDDR